MSVGNRIAIFASVLVGCWGGDSSELHERIPVEAGDVVRIRLDMGVGMDRDESSITVSPHDSNVVGVDARGSGGPPDALRLAASRRQGEILIEGAVTGALSWLYGGPIVEAEVRIPPGHDVEVTSTAGHIRVVALRGPLKVRALGAEVEVRETAGPIAVHSTHGDVLAADNQGPLVVETLRGDVRIERTAEAVEVRAGRGDIEVESASGAVVARAERGDVDIIQAGGPVEARTGRGSINLEDAAGPVDARTDRGTIEARFSGAPAGTLRTERGSIRVAFPSDTGVELDARTKRGDVKLDPDLELDAPVTRESAVGMLGRGGPRLELRSSRGDIELEPR